MKSDGRSRGGRGNKKEKRITTQKQGRWLVKIHNLHQGKKEEERGEEEKEGCTLKHASFQKFNSYKDETK